MAVRTWALAPLMLLSAAAPAPASDATAAAESVAFVNPIFTGTPPVVTTTDATNTSAAVNISVWTGGLRAGATYDLDLFVEGGGYAQELDDFFSPEPRRLSGVSWEPPKEWPDGVYTLRVVLERLNDDFGWDPVAEQEMDFRLLHQEGTRTHRASYPLFPSLTNRVGFFGHLDERPAATVFYYVNEGAPHVRAVYSTAAPGSPPGWRACGATAAEEDGGGWVRCRLAAGDDPRDVVLLGVLANATAPDLSPDPALDTAGEAVLVRGYEVRPQVRFAEGELHGVDHDACMGLRVDVTDHSGFVPLWGADVDVLVRGSRFGAALEPPQFEAPDDGDEVHPSAACGENGSREATQGSHGDGWHVEGTTDVFGEIGFLLAFENRARTSLVAWVDRDRDDAMDPEEERIRLRFDGDPSFSVWAEPGRVQSGRAAWLYATPRAVGCGMRELELQSRVPKGRWKKRFDTSMNDLGFEVAVRPRRTTLYRVVVASDLCPRWTSDPVRVRVVS